MDTIRAATANPEVWTCGPFIKACGMLENLPRCWTYSESMRERGVLPTPVVVG